MAGVKPHNVLSLRIGAWTLALISVLLVFDVFAVGYFDLAALGYLADFLVLLACFRFIAIGVATGVFSRFAVLLLIASASYTALSGLGRFNDGLPSAIWSSILFSKIFILFFAAKNLKLIELHSVILILSVVHATGMALNFIVPSFFESLLLDVPFERDISRVMGFLLNDNKSAALSTILALYFWFVRNSRIIGLVFSCAVFLTGSVSFLVVFISAAAYLQFLRSPKSAALLVIPVLALSVYALRYSIDISSKLDLIRPDGSGLYIRSVMLFQGIELALEFFPFGTGGGTFGSSLSGGSPVYSYLGIENLRSVEEMTGVFDSSIGAILGEYGALGFLITLILLFYLFRLRGASLITFSDAVFLVSLTIFLSFFRSVIPDFYYSAFFLLLILIVGESRIRSRVSAGRARTTKSEEADSGFVSSVT